MGTNDEAFCKDPQSGSGLAVRTVEERFRTLSEFSVGTTQPTADMFTKASFTEEGWKKLCKLVRGGPPNIQLRTLSKPQREETRRDKVVALSLSE